MALKRVSDIAGALESDGAYYYSFFYKPSIASPGVAGRILDTSQSTGTPKYNAYVGAQLEATPLIGNGNDGIYSGSGFGAGTEKRIMGLSARVTTAVVPVQIMLCDFLMFYPLVDLDSTDLQETISANTLPRYTSGEGVRMFLSSQVQSTATASATINYTNSAGISKSVTTQITSGTTNMLVNSAGSGGTDLFIPLTSGDLGVRSVESIQLSSAIGGFASLVLCRPLTSLTVYEQNTQSEISFINDKFTFPKIEDGAYLQFLALTGAAGVVSLQGEMLIVGG